MTVDNKQVTRSLFSIRNYLVFFGTISFVVSCSFLLFLSNLEVQSIDIKKSAIITFGNVLFLSFLFSVIDGIRRKITVERPVKRIISATQKMTQGDFFCRIKPFHRLDSMNEFDIIIEDFNKMAQELSSIETLRTDFVANVSHELKTPLAVIQNYASMLQDTNLPQDKHVEYAKNITNASRRLSELITNILKLNKLENQQIYPKAMEYDVSEQIRQCLLAFEDLWEAKNLELVTNIEDMTIFADADLLSIVWNNLFSNAIKFTEHGGKITVILTEQEEFAVIKVSDTGCGMSQDIGMHIFEKFYQGDKSHATQGNGLGLALVRRVVDIVGGDISVESTVGKGSTFTVKINRINNS